VREAGEIRVNAREIRNILPNISEVHQGLENRLLRPLGAVGEPHARVKRSERLGGMLSYYHREAA
jgi:hypothetical protein